MDGLERIENESISPSTIEWLQTASFHRPAKYSKSMRWNTQYLLLLRFLRLPHAETIIAANSVTVPNSIMELAAPCASLRQQLIARTLLALMASRATAPRKVHGTSDSEPWWFVHPLAFSGFQIFPPPHGHCCHLMVSRSTSWPVFWSTSDRGGRVCSFREDSTQGGCRCKDIAPLRTARLARVKEVSVVHLRATRRAVVATSGGHPD